MHNSVQAMKLASEWYHDRTRLR